ncbi:MAG: cytochrome-c peroxidase [Gammaproteobacteria bacterium]|nr:cytochrome-c peroxidase [Gammaproteobacteria bacterium]
MRFKSLSVVTVIFTVLLACHGTVIAAERITLSSKCPPSFEKLENGLCELRSLYEFYNSPAGFGGLKTPLPEHQGGYSAEQIDLGRYLFFDPLLSGDKTKACSSCHQPGKGFSDGLARSVGIDNEVLERSAPSLWNVGFLKSLFWDGRAKSLQEQAKGPLFEKKEMNNTIENLEFSLNKNKTYRALFNIAYPESRTISVNEVSHALAAFQSSLVSLNSRYDRYAHGDQEALTEQERIGHTVFRSFAARCSQCHTPPLFTNQQLAVTAAPEPEGKEFDVGAEKISGQASLRGAFKVPTLRNITLSAPFMHSGALADLESVISFYNNERGHAVADQELQLHWHLVNPRLNEDDEFALLAFLKTLEDETTLPRVPEVLPSGLLLKEAPMYTAQSIP